MDKKEKHIVLFISSLARGGAERVVINLAQYMLAKGMKVTIVTQYKNKDEYELPKGAQRIFSEITEAEQKGGRIGNFIARYKKLRRIWKEQNPDCILSFIGKNNFMAVLAAAFTKIPVVVSICGEPLQEYDSKMSRLLVKVLFAWAEGAIVITRPALDFLPSYVKKKAVLLKNPLDPTFIRSVYEGQRDGRIVSVGRMDTNKNHEMIVRAFAEIAEEYPKVSLAIYGEGECRPKLQQMAEQLGIAERVELPGAVSDVAERICQSSIFVLSSFFEGGGPNVLTEAMCLGIPCISTDCPSGGPGEQIQDGENGLLIPVGDEAALVKKLRFLLDNEEIANKIGENAAKVQEKYKDGTVIGEWVDFLLLKGRK